MQGRGKRSLASIARERMPLPAMPDLETKPSNQPAMSGPGLLQG